MLKKLCILTLIMTTLNYVHAVDVKQGTKIVQEEKIITENIIEVELPDDVAIFIEKSKECAYWVDEWSPDLEKTRKENIEAKINNICLEIMDQRTQLLDKYRDQADLIEILQ